MDLFDAAESERRKQEGMARAAAAKPLLLQYARDLAVSLAYRHGEVNMDQVNAMMVMAGIPEDALGPAAGAVFKSKEWEFTGKFIKSSRVTNHSRLIRVWRLKEAT